MKMIQEPGRTACVPSEPRECIRIGIVLVDFNLATQLFLSVHDNDGALTWTTGEHFYGTDSPTVMAERLRALAAAIEKRFPTPPGARP